MFVRGTRIRVRPTAEAVRRRQFRSSLTLPQLTTIDQDANLAGRMLVSKLIDKGDGPAISQRLETSLLIRESCGG